MLVFQYGSNMNGNRMNAKDRLGGDAHRIGIARTMEPHVFCFPVWSKTNNCAAASISPSITGRQIFGVLYAIPDWLVNREEASAKSRNSLDAIEGEGINYSRITIDILQSNDERISASTYVAAKSECERKTSAEYATHILSGLAENCMPRDYCRYVGLRILRSNPALKSLVHEWESRSA